MSKGKEIITIMPESIRAYRVENTNGLVSSNGNKAILSLNEFGNISISFSSDEHSEYYSDKHKDKVLKTWEMDSRFYKYAMSYVNNGVDTKNKYHKKRLSTPRRSDGNISEWAKKNALTFGKDWIDVLNKAVKSDVTVYE